MFLLERDGIPFNFIDLDQQGGSIHQPIDNENAVVSVVDTRGELDKKMIDRIKGADMVIVPTRNSLSDQPALMRMIEILKDFDRQKPILFVLNCLNRYTASKQFVDWFADEYPHLKYLPLSQSETFNASAAMQKSVCALKPSSGVAQQINAIYGVVKYELQLSNKER